MNSYVATFHTHLSALMTCNELKTQGVSARMAPVPRKLSSSCGTCVFYDAAEPNIDAMDEDVEGIYEVSESGQYVKILEKE